MFHLRFARGNVSAVVSYKDIDLTNSKLGSELLKDPKGELLLNVWRKYCREPNREWRPVIAWCVDPSDPDIASVPPQRAVDEAGPLVSEVIRHLRSDSRAEALATAYMANDILVRGSSTFQPKRGKSASMQQMAVRAYTIRKFNPHPKRAGESTVGWDRLADLLFLKDGKCPRHIRDKHVTRICDLTKHRYNSSCVKALMTAVTHLKAAMKHDGIPV